MNLKGKKVLVTGAGGFIGSHLCSKLIQMGADTTAMLHYSSRSDWSNLEFLSTTEKNSLKVVRGCIEDSGFVDRHVAGKDIVLHLAALIGIPYSYEAPLSYVRVNIEGTVNVLEAVRKFNVARMVHTSTSETFGTALYTPIDEKHPLQGQSPYSASKIAADKLAESYFKSFATPVVTLRPFNTYGPRQSARAVIPTIISQLISHNKLMLGDLSPVRDFNYVEDTVAGFISAAITQKIEGELINIGFGKSISIEELAKQIMKLMGKSIELTTDKSRVRPKDSEVFELICDNTKAKKLLNWEPTTNFSEGLKRTIEFVQNNQDFYKSSTYGV